MKQTITIDDFAKTEIRVSKVVKAAGMPVGVKVRYFKDFPKETDRQRRRKSLGI